MYLKVITCKALFREITYYASISENVIDLTSLEWGLHDKVGGLYEALKAEIAAIDAGKDSHSSYPPYGQPFDGIVLGYGLCSNGIVGLSSSRYPLIVPRAHDCITLLLGSKERYAELFKETGGTYWYSPGWVENSPIPGEGRLEWMRNLYADRYNPEDVEEMLELSEEWQESYSRLGLISWPEFKEREFARITREKARESAEYAGWQLTEYEGSGNLVKDLIDGNWDPERFLVVPPGETIKQDYGTDIIKY